MLDRGGMAALADALGESVRACVSVSLLRRGLCRASVVGPPERFDAALVAFDFMPDEPMAFGTDAEAIVDLLEETDRKWGCVETTPEMVRPVGASIVRRLNTSVRYYDAVYLSLEAPVQRIEHPAVRLLRPEDEALWQSVTHPDVRAAGFGDEASHLRESFAAAAIVDGRIVSMAQCAGFSSRYADIGIHTLESFRRQGLAAACVSAAAGEAQRRGLVPVWSTGIDNGGSLATARKVGFRDAERAAYAILERS